MPVHDFLDTVDGPTVVMPYYDLGSLEEFERIGEDLCVKVLLDLLLGLSHLHGRGVVHRDLKLANLLVEKPFNIIIADFGLSKFAEDGLFTTFCGTAKNLAPEVFPGVQASYGPKADVWSIAVLLMGLYLSEIPRPPELPPLNKRSELRRWSQDWTSILLKTLHNADENDDQVIDILLHMLEPDPEKRYSASECLARGCSNGLFRRTDNGHVVVAAEASPEEDGARTPTLSSHQRGAAISPLCVQGFGRPARRQKTVGNSSMKSWSLTIGPSNSDSDDGFDVTDPGPRHYEGHVTGLFIKRDHFSINFASQETHEESEQLLEGEQMGVAAAPRPAPVVWHVTAP